MPPTPSFTQAFADKVASALPTIDKKPRWIEGIRDLPATLSESSVFLFNAAERADPPRLLNGDQQILVSNINILIVLSKAPRPSAIESETLDKIKNSIRTALQGWTPPAQIHRQFFPCRLLAGTPIANALSAQDGKIMWLETVQCKHIATTEPTP